MTTAHKTEETESSIAAQLQRATERLAELEAQAKQSFEKHLEDLGTLIKKHPLAAVGIGFGIGYILARLLRRD